MIIMPVPEKIDMNKREKYVKVYFSRHELEKLKLMANEVHLRLSPFIRNKSLSKGTINPLKNVGIERITKKSIELMVGKDAGARDFRDVMNALKNKEYDLCTKGSLEVGQKSDSELEVLIAQFHVQQTS